MKRKTIKIEDIEGYITTKEHDIDGFEYQWIDGLYVYKKIGSAVRPDGERNIN